jgi:glycosyltransferase involved in cell wall biosynthesis
VSELAAAPIRRLVGDRGAVSVVPNAIDLEQWRVAPVPRDPDRVVIAAVMRLAARKRPIALVRALRHARMVVPGHVELRAVIVGDGPQRRAIERYCARHGMADWVHLTGPLSHAAIRSLYRRADLFVNPAILESFGIAALEARTAGVPVIAMRRSAIGTFVTHGLSGVLVDGDDGLANAIAALASDPSSRAALAERSRAVVPAFGWDDALDRVDHAYTRAAALQEVRPPRRVGAGIVAEVRP